MATLRLCSIPDCGKRAVARGWCYGHHKRFKRHGNPLAGGTVRGAATRYFKDTVLTYEGDDCLPWPYGHIKGYGVLSVDGRQHFVSRAVCEAVNGPPPTSRHEAAHLCGRGGFGCCTKRHIVWKTPIENQADRIVNGTDQFGERNAISKLSDADVREIRAMKGMATLKAIGTKFGMTPSAIGYILRGKTWAHLK